MQLPAVCVRLACHCQFEVKVVANQSGPQVRKSDQTRSETGHTVNVMGVLFGSQ